jgi:hypothetical protein
MPEHHEIIGPARGEPLPADRAGARIRVPLDASPSPRWSGALTARLATGLTGHPAVGHLRLNGVVQGPDIVLEGVEQREAELLGPVLRAAIDAANHACAATDDQPPTPLNMDAAQARDVAHAVSVTVGVAG